MSDFTENLIQTLNGFMEVFLGIYCLDNGSRDFLFDFKCEIGITFFRDIPKLSIQYTNKKNGFVTSRFLGRLKSEPHHDGFSLCIFSRDCTQWNEIQIHRIEWQF